jgi:hypothetical protein
LLDGSGHGFSKVPYPWDGFGEPLSDHHLRRGTCVRWLSREHLIKHATQRVDVSPRVYCLTCCLLRAHVGRRPDCETGLGELLSAGHADSSGNAKIRNHRVTPAQQDVLRLEIPMHNSLAVCVTQRVRNLAAGR